MRPILHREADAEFQAAVEYYQAKSQDLGIRFYREVFMTLSRIESHPKAWPRLRGTVRKCLVSEFPYKLLYTIEPDRIFVVAVMHVKRAPNYWLNRM